MEFFYTDADGTEQGPFNERQMTDWLRDEFFSENLRVRFIRNGKQFNPTIARMRVRNGHCTPFIFSKCDRVDLEKELWKDHEAAAKATDRIQTAIDDFVDGIPNDVDERTVQVMARIREKIEAANASIEEAKKAPAPVARKELTPPVELPANEPSTSKPSKRVLPLFDIRTFEESEKDLGEDKVPIKIFREFLHDIDLYAAQRHLKFPIYEKCRGCGSAVEFTELHRWLTHITSQNHIDKFRLKGGRVTQQCLDWYSDQLFEFAKRCEQREVEEEKENEEASISEDPPVNDETVDLEKKKLEFYFGVITLPAYVPLLHIDPSDTITLGLRRGREEISKLRSLIFDKTDKRAAAKNLHLPTTMCEVCNEKFDYAPKIFPHMFSNSHIDKYLAKRGSFSQHDFDFWTAICVLFPETERDTRDEKAVRAQLKQLAREVNADTCKEPYTVYEKGERRKHVVDFIKKQLTEHERPVVVYERKEDMGLSTLEYLKEKLPENRVGWANTAEECADLEVIVTDCTLLLTRPHSIVFPVAPTHWKEKADCVQKMNGEFVEANLIVAHPEEYNEVKRINHRAIVLPSTSRAPLTSPTAYLPSSDGTGVHHSAPPLPPPLPVSRPAPPVASVNPFVAQPNRAPQTPQTPTNQRAYDPNQSPESPGKAKCAVM